MNIPRSEYPRPQMVRDNWLCLNGTWEFEFDFGKSGKERNVLSKEKLEREIIVPFCPESELSGINYKDFIPAAWYRKKLSIPENINNDRVFLNFEAVDYYCEVYIIEKYVGCHRGGYTPFSFDITKLLTGDDSVTLYVEDDTRSPMQPSGKQSYSYNSRGCSYTRTTGIWQSVWLEFVPDEYIKDFKIEPDVDNQRVILRVDTSAAGEVSAEAFYDGKKVGESLIKTTGKSELVLDISELHLWEVGNAKLYDLVIKFGSDEIKSYFGMRKIELSKKAMLINGKSIFQRLVLDQGFYEEGIYTAPSDEALVNDIHISLAAGFNGARLHQKVFERRFLYHADRLGYIVWGEYASWGFDHTIPEAYWEFLPQWEEAVARDYNSPALIGWCPFNETWDIVGKHQFNRGILNIYRITKELDKTRPVIDTSGNYHVATDIYDIHNYEQNPEVFKEQFAPMANGGEVFDNFKKRQSYGGQPYFISEYGGIRWSDDESGWGYGNTPKNLTEYEDRYIKLAAILLENPNICGFCYTQLYDIEQEQNGIYYYNRTPKFDNKMMQRMSEAIKKKAAIEE